MASAADAPGRPEGAVTWGVVLSKSLELGSCGVQWEPPGGAIGEHTHTSLAVRDDHGLTWRVTHHPVEFAIAAGEEAALAEDLYLSSRTIFEMRWAAKHGDAQPRTASGWSPVIDAKLGAIGEGRIARCVRRLAYEQGEETVVGHLFVPVQQGTIEIRIAARTDQTGTREHVVATKYGGKQAQQVYDNVELDPYFPDHPLSRVRAALDATVASLEIVALPERAPGAEVPLAETGAAIMPPVRFVPTPTVAASNRGEVVRLGVDGWRRAIHVWRAGRHKLKGKDLHAALVEHADNDATAWSAAGASSIASHSAAIDDYGVCLQVQQYVTFVRDGFIRHAVQRWWIAGDGTLWRIGEDAPADVDRQTLLEDVVAVQESFRRI